jgi:lysozyme
MTDLTLAGIRPMKTSLAGRAFIKQFEQLKLRAYPDPKWRGISRLPTNEGTWGKPWTIGYGHTGPDVVEFKQITATTAEKIFDADVAEREAVIYDLVNVPLNQGQFDALVSFVFNVGAEAFRNSTLLKKLNAGDYAGAADELLRWNKAGGKVLDGLTRRRQDERAMFLGLNK